LRIGACLSLTGRFAPFGRQAAAGFETWRSLDGTADILIEDDGSERKGVGRVLPGIARRCDLLLGPYSTVLMREAGRLAAEHGWLAWNHGGSGDDVQAAHPGHVVSVLTPASRYAEPFLRLIAGERRELVIAAGAGSFGRQVADGAHALARTLGIPAVRVSISDPLPERREWDLLSAGVFEDDAGFAGRALRAFSPPRRVCAIAAGVREFGRAVSDPEGVYGIAQWFPGAGGDAQTGPGEGAFLRAYAGRARAAPGYPAAQAAAGAAIAAHCARLAGSTARADLWDAAAGLVTSTLFGGFRVDPVTGAQAGKPAVLVRWSGGELASAAAVSRSGRRL
jgi:hypothetical protein